MALNRHPTIDLDTSNGRLDPPGTHLLRQLLLAVSYQSLNMEDKVLRLAAVRSSGRLVVDGDGWRGGVRGGIEPFKKCAPPQNLAGDHTSQHFQ